MKISVMSIMQYASKLQFGTPGSSIALNKRDREVAFEITNTSVISINSHIIA